MVCRRRRRRRRCRYCRNLFLPDPHIKNQKSCGKPTCSKARHSQADQKWRTKAMNREYFCGRYRQLKAWLAKPENRGYLRRYREKRRDQRQAGAYQIREAPPLGPSPLDSRA